ncbi:MAG: sugar phosphate isomerase/epimerase [Candidatus Omnitrophica bacterium]|nr:sugar phosphate isomerase/epimerase [Candidatus Omnitrophota bacterium]
MKKRFLYSVNTNGLPKQMSISEKVKLISKTGFNGVEWGLPSKIDEVKKCIKEMMSTSEEEGLNVISFINAGPFWKKDHLERISEIIAPTKVRQIRVSPPWVAFDYQESLHQKESANELFLRMREKIYQAVEVGKKYNMRYLLETHMGSICACPFVARSLIDGLNENHVGIIYDPANGIVEGGYRPRASVEFLGNYLGYIHAKNVKWFVSGQTQDRPLRTRWSWQVCSLSEGIVDYVEVFFALKVTGWSGWISVEEFFSEKPEEQLKAGLNFLKDCESVAPENTSEPFLSFND